ncbi:MAG: hypothetical protein U1A27_07575 [Phycisphaerae bacterium]
MNEQLPRGSGSPSSIRPRAASADVADTPVGEYLFDQLTDNGGRRGRAMRTEPVALTLVRADDDEPAEPVDAPSSGAIRLADDAAVAEQSGTAVRDESAEAIAESVLLETDDDPSAPIALPSRADATASAAPSTPLRSLVELPPLARPSRFLAPDDPVPSEIEPQREPASAPAALSASASATESPPPSRPMVTVRATIESTATTERRPAAPATMSGAEIAARVLDAARSGATPISEPPAAQPSAAETVAAPCETSPPARIGRGSLTAQRVSWKPGDPFGATAPRARFRWDLMLSTACGTAACGLVGIWLLRTLLS